MKIAGGVEWAVHCCVVLTGTDHPVPAARLAEFHDVSSTYLAKQMLALSRAGIVRSAQGNAGGYQLARPAAEVTMLDVVRAVEGDGRMFRCTEIRQRGPFATPPEDCTQACPIARAMWAAEDAWREALRAITIADLAAQVGEGGPDRLATIGAWLGARDGG